MAKVIHVHLTRPIDGTKRRDWYFASIAAVYTVLMEKARLFDPFGHAGFDPSGKIRMTP